MVRASGLGAVRVAGLGGAVARLGERPRPGVGVGDGAGEGLGVGGQPARGPVAGLGGAVARPVSARAWSSGSVMVRARASARSGSPAWAAAVARLGERPGLAVGVGDGAGEGLGVGGQPVGAVQVAGLGGRGDQAGERPAWSSGLVMVRARASASAASRWARSGSPAWAAAVTKLVSARAWSSGSVMVAGKGLGAVQVTGLGGRGGQAQRAPAAWSSGSVMARARASASAGPAGTRGPGHRPGRPQ